MFNMCSMLPKNLLSKCNIEDKEKKNELSVSEVLFSKDSVENNSALITSILKLK